MVAGWQGPRKNRQGPGKNNWTDYVPSGLPNKKFGILGIFGIKKSKKTTRVLIHDSFPMTHGHFRHISVMSFEMHCTST